MEGSFTCPECGKPVTGEPRDCPHCRLTFLHTCSCGESWHLARLKCPACGEKHSYRRRVHRRFYTKRRFKVAAVLLLLAALLGVNLYLIVLRSPSRRKHEHLLAGHRDFERGDYASAKLHFREYVKEEPQAAEALFMLGLTHLRLGDTEQAEQTLLRAVEARPSLSLAQVALSELYRREGRVKEALERAELAVEFEPVPTQAWRALGDIRIELRDQEGAIKALLRAVGGKQASIETYLELGDLYRSREVRGLEDVNAGLARRRYEEARELADGRVFDNPEDLEARILLAKAHAGLREFDSAIREVERVVEAEPGESGHRLLLARYQVAKEDYRRASATLEKAWSETPGPEVAVELARVQAVFLDDPAGAEAVLRRGVERFPQSPGLRIALIALLLRQGNLGGARQEMEEALGRFPEDTRTLEASADLLLAEGESDEAAERLREALRARPQNLGARRKLVLILLGDAIKSIERGDPEAGPAVEVRAHIDFFLSVNPGDLRARAWRARLAYAGGDFESAADILGDLEKQSEDSYFGLRMLGISRLQSGNYSGASSALFRALAHPDCPLVSDDFEIAYVAAFRSGQATRQVEISKRALERSPEDPTWQLRLAGALLRDGKPREALEICRVLKERLANTRDVKAHLLAARIHQTIGEVDAARKELEDAVAIRRDAETRGALYQFFASIGKTDLAEQGFEALLGEMPGDLSVVLRYGEYLFRQSRRPDLTAEQLAGLRKRAIDQFRKVLNVDPRSRKALIRVADLTMADASDPAVAIEAAEEAVHRISDLNPDDPYLLYFSGKLDLLRKEFEAARVDLSEFVRKVPEDPAGFYYLGVAYLRTGDLSRAREQFRAVLQIDPGMVEAKLELAALYFSEGLRAHWNRDWDAARQAFERVSSIDPEEPESRRFLAEAFVLLGMSDRAMEEANRVLAVKPDDRGALFITGLTLARRGEFELAEGRFERLVALEPENEYAHLYHGVILAELGDFDTAREEILRSYALDRDSDEVLRALVLCETEAGREEELLQFMEQERVRTPNRAAVHAHLGWLYRRSGRLKDAVDAYATAFRKSPEDVLALAMAAAVLADEGRLDDAIGLLDEGAAVSPVPGRLLLLKGRLLIEKGEEEDGETALRQSLVADPDLAEAYGHLGLLLLEKGRAADAERMLLAGVQRGLRDPAVHFRLAQLASRRRDWKTAASCYRQVLELVPDDFATLNNLASVLSESAESREEAVEIARRAHSLHPADPRAADTLGWILSISGKQEEAVALLIQAAEELPDDPVVLHHAGMCCYRLYRWSEATRYLERAREASPDYPGAEEAKKALEEMR